MIRKNILSIVFFFAFVVVGFSQTEEVSVYNLKSINSPKMDFAAIPYGDGLMYTSTNGEQFGGRVDKCNTNDYFSKLYYSKRDDNMVGTTDGGQPSDGMGGVNSLANDPACGFTAPTLIGGELAGKFHDGTPTFSPDGNQMVFSRNYPGKSNFMNACNDGRNNLRLMSADRVGDEWVNVQELPLSNAEYNTAHPSFSPDGQCLYFSSDRPGGVGGMDLYKVCRSGEGWGTPMNLGAPINTSANDLFPYVARDGSLYYSSNGLAGGQGGLDVYTTKESNGTWTTPENLGAPINSAGDDLGFILSADGESGYLTSNRAGGEGGDDIYCWRINKAPVNLAIEDAATKERLCNTLVKVKEVGQTRDYTTSNDCLALPDITHRRCYTLEVDEPGYEYWSKEVCAMDLATSNPYIIPLVKKTYPLCGNVIYEDQSIVTNPTVTLRNKVTGEEMNVTADKDGKFCTEVTCLDDYEVLASKNDKSSNKDVMSADISCDGGDNTVTLVLPKPPPPPVPACACQGNPIESFNLPLAIPVSLKPINRLGSRPQFGNSHGLSASEFYNKLKTRHASSTADAKFLDEVFQGMGYSGFNDPLVSEYIFSETVLSPGISGNMGYTKRHRIKYVRLNTTGKDLEAFRINANGKALNSCHVHFMKTCGNFFFFCAS